jgi:hypothetical protein
MGSQAIAGHPSERVTLRTDKVAIMASPESPDVFTDFINVLVLVGVHASPVSRALSRLTIESSPDGVMVNVFDDLAHLPRYRAQSVVKEVDMMTEHALTAVGQPAQVSSERQVLEHPTVASRQAAAGVRRRWS